ncbi:hypothetical protein FA15DRAFT_656207 [Coprinopsis marcescibilis]|uniref:Uncharacterized protein n=1 Tax=Coprinopsis marcescibilis TaxID=230819 RepID=A0A5C3KV06_COPMA|nr:hypothetical protein FA15DRAFT_656207 [Coprinopsis marcescibilis]
MCVNSCTYTWHFAKLTFLLLYPFILVVGPTHTGCINGCGYGEEGGPKEDDDEEDTATLSMPDAYSTLAVFTKLLGEDTAASLLPSKHTNMLAFLTRLKIALQLFAIPKPSPPLTAAAFNPTTIQAPIATESLLHRRPPLSTRASTTMVSNCRFFEYIPLPPHSPPSSDMPSLQHAPTISHLLHQPTILSNSDKQGPPSMLNTHPSTHLTTAFATHHAAASASGTRSEPVRHDDGGPARGNDNNVELWNWIFGGNVPPQSDANRCLVRNLDWLCPGQVGNGGGIVNPPPGTKPPSEQRLILRMGLEGLGETNKGNDTLAYCGEDFAPVENLDNPEEEEGDGEREGGGTPPPGYIWVNSGKAAAEVQVLSDQAGCFLMALAAGCCECLLNATTSTTMVTNLLDIFHTLNKELLPGTLIYWVNVMHFAVLVMHQQKRTSKALSAIFKAVVHEVVQQGHTKVSVPLLQCYYHDGSAIAIMASAGYLGSIYLVIIMACCRICQDIRGLNPEFYGRIACKLQMPHSHLMRAEPLMMSRLVPASLLHSHGKLEINCTDLTEQDTFFNGFSVNEYIKLHDVSSWAAAMVPNPPSMPLSIPPVFNQLPSPPPPSSPLLPPSPPPLLPSSPPASERSLLLGVSIPPPNLTFKDAVYSDDTFVVDTEYSHELNSKVGYDWNNVKLHHRYTEKERKATLAALEATEVNKLRILLQQQLLQGKCQNKTKWVEMDSGILNGHMLHVNDKDGEALLTIPPPIPKDLVCDFLNTLLILFPGDFVETNTKEEGIVHSFPAIHVDIYGCYSNRGDAVPPEVEPSSIHKTKKKKLNTCQNLPRTSKEWNKNTDLYQCLQDATTPIFAWVRENLDELFPGTFEILSQFVKELLLHLWASLKKTWIG